MGEPNLKVILYDHLVVMNSVLTEHIQIHDSIFDPPLRAKIPIPGIFRKIPFDELYQRAARNQDKLEGCLLGLKGLTGVDMDDDRAAVQKIREYGICFLASSSKLTEIAYELDLKAQRKNKLSLKEYSRLVDEYRQNEQHRLSKGDSMNEIVSLLQPSQA
ncbi:hypothetical protein V1499_23110 (plasmid) [Neobacillus sp. SCS-31]|uniref:hypothetical protein n=1 Tax=Neobacillus oceani TaxID=3115292 RepID=UPI0039057CDE